jgi:hypothetical protein
MSLAITKTNFEELIADDNNAVIALSGKWGTGKSYLWRAVQKDSGSEAVKKALYISLFGVKDILQLKMKILQSAVPDSKTGHAAREVITTAWKESSKFLKTLHPGFAALNEIALLAVPAILRNRVIVIDDIERKHATLSIDEVMGFIDEFTQVYGSRIILILNSDQLDDKKLWETLREKVIDHEVALETTPEEAFDIAIANVPSARADEIRRATVLCKISNIRINQKIIRMVERLLGARPSLSNDVLRRVIPSTVLLAAIHYKGLQDGPTLDYVLQFNSVAHAMSRVGRKKDGHEETDADRLARSWDKLLNELGISSADDFEIQVAAFLKSGLRDASKFDPIFDRYAAEKDRFAAHARYEEFFDTYWWHPGRSEADLLEDAKSLVPMARLLGCYETTNLAAVVAELPGGGPTADQLVAGWLVEFRRNPPTEFSNHNFFNRELHPLIQAEFDGLSARLNPVPSLFDAYAHIVNNSGWGRAQEEALKSATPVAFEAEIKRLLGEDLRLFMAKNVEMHVQRSTYENHFGESSWAFVAACQKICHENANPRLTKTIEMLFKRENMGSLLIVYDRPQPQAMPDGQER